MSYPDPNPPMDPLPIETPAGYIRFGPLPSQVMPIDWAEKVLYEVARKYPSQFGVIVRDAMLRGFDTQAGRLRQKD